MECGLFGGGFGFGGVGFAGVGFGELAAEALDAARGVDELLLAGEEGVAGRADFEHDGEEHVTSKGLSRRRLRRFSGYTDSISSLATKVRFAQGANGFRGAG